MIETAIPWFFWLFPLAITIHNIEEALWLPGWSKSAGRFHKAVGAFEFSFPLFWYITVPFAALVIGSIPVLFKIGRMIQASMRNI